ncbi:MAG: hypothetical protein IJ560_03385 [Alphaproteobacteria bacterium]|nr:hypothetical protein [Alphaproteobacteria bacterium]
MRKIAIFIMVVTGLVFNADAAPRANARGGTGASTAAAGNTAARAPVAARAATNQRAPVARTAPAGGGNTGVAARSATPTTKTTATTAVKSTGNVAARAASKQKVVGSGTKVSTAAANVVVSEECQQKYDGCMDSFCMLENGNGGRCVCSDKNKELDEILAQIEKLDQQSYQMATAGVERIEMGSDADAAIAAANAAAKAVSDTGEQKKNTRRTLDLSAWNVSSLDFDDDDIFGGDDAVSSLANKEGDALHRAAAEVCTAQIPECGNEIKMLQMVYSQRIKSDCNAYENSLKQQKTQSQQKLATAERALRDAALDQLHAANKYDLGQCTIEFKNCMATTAGCNSDFTGCVGLAAAENSTATSAINTTRSTRSRTSTKAVAKQYTIQGTASKITIAASTYDTLLAKKPLCESVTKQCVNVADKVWDTFLREAAPQLKTAELSAESNLRMSCIANISDCFQRACKDTMDPNDPDGSYDMCLSRPETLRSLCKVQIDPCEAAEPMIMDYVVARLASMRVDSCTKEVKACLQSDDRCGADYSQCIGLDTDSIIRMCPYDKLVGCQQVYTDKNIDIRGEGVYDELATMVQGIMLNIDNNFLMQCQNAANNAMIKVCGDSDNCNGLAVDNNIGTHSLEYKICEYTGDANSMAINYSACRTDVSQIQDSELGRGGGAPKAFASVLDGTIYWEQVSFDENGTISLPQIADATAAQQERVNAELNLLQASIRNAIDTIESDPTVQYCMTGREVQGMKTTTGPRTGGAGGATTTRGKIGDTSNGGARFPGLTKQMRMLIAQAAVKAAKDNYYKKYEELNAKMLKDYATIGERLSQIVDANNKDARREIARQACVSMSEASALPKSANPPKNPFGKVLAAAALVGAAVALPIAGPAVVAAVPASMKVAAAIGTASVIGGAAVGTAGIGLLGNAGSGNANGADNDVTRDLVGSKQVNQWNYQETVTSTFAWESLNCHTCTRSRTCAKTKNPIFGNKYCKDWGDWSENCKDTQF